MVQNHPKISPKWLHFGPKMGQEWPCMAPMAERDGLQKASKTTKKYPLLPCNALYRFSFTPSLVYNPHLRRLASTMVSQYRTIVPPPMLTCGAARLTQQWLHTPPVPTNMRRFRPNQAHYAASMARLTPHATAYTTLPSSRPNIIPSYTPCNDRKVCFGWSVPIAITIFQPAQYCWSTCRVSTKIPPNYENPPAFFNEKSPQKAESPNPVPFPNPNEMNPKERNEHNLC